MTSAEKAMRLLKKRIKGLEGRLRTIYLKSTDSPKTGKYNLDKDSDSKMRSIWRQIHKIMKTEFRDIYFKKRFKKLLSQ